METKTLKVSGMSCQMCVKHVTQALQNVEGVENVTVDLEPGTAQVTYNADTTSMADWKSAVAEAGYEVVGEA